MKKTILIFVLPLLLALAPTAASAARILWIGIDETAMIVDPADEQTKPIYQFQASGKVLNAAQVSVEDLSGTSSTYLCFVYEDDQGHMVVDPDATTTEVNFPSASGSGSGAGTGTSSGSDPATTSDWLAAYLGDIDDETATVTLELGHVDWAAVDAAYENNPSGVGVSIDFTPLAVATASWGELVSGDHISEQASVSTPGATPWTPTSYTAVPEPSVCCMALLGVLLLARRRRARGPGVA